MPLTIALAGPPCAATDRYVSERESDGTDVVAGLALLDAIRYVEEIADRAWGVARPAKKVSRPVSV